MYGCGLLRKSKKNRRRLDILEVKGRGSHNVCTHVRTWQGQSRPSVFRMSKPLTYEGCNFFRQRLVLATLSSRPVRINGIRVDSDEPGLKGVYYLPAQCR